MVTKRRTSSNAVFKAIADPTRRHILRLLRTGNQPVNAIAAHFQTSRPAISRHLRLLCSAGLVVTRKRGNSRICELHAQPLRAVDQWIQDYAIFWNENLHNLKRYVEENP